MSAMSELYIFVADSLSESGDEPTDAAVQAAVERDGLDVWAARWLTACASDGCATCQDWRLYASSAKQERGH